MIKRATLVFLFLLVVLTVSGCCKKVSLFSVEDHLSQEQNILGISQSKNDKIDIFFVHGMGGYAKGDPKTAIEKICLELGLAITGEDSFSIKPINSAIQGSGYVERIYSADQNGKSVHFYVVFWSGITSFFSNKLIYNDNIYNNRMVKLNRDAKEEYLNSKISDVILYQNSTIGAELRHIIGEATRQTQKNSDIYFLTYSLGSKIVFDLLFEKMSSEAERAQYVDFTSRVKSFFMLANQIPLLDIGPDNTFWPTLKMLNSTREITTQKHWVVAFSDVNDILSYGLNTNSQDNNQVGLEETFINVLVTNEDCAYTFGTYGNCVNPEKAHLGYGGNLQVLDIITNGYQVTQ